MEQAGRRGIGGAVHPEPAHGWTFLTNHAHVMVALALDPDMRVRDLADAVGITERAAQRIVGELVDAGYLRREKHGRRNRYHLDASRPLRHPLEGHHTIGRLLNVLAEDAAPDVTEPGARTRSAG